METEFITDRSDWWFRWRIIRIPHLWKARFNPVIAKLPDIYHIYWFAFLPIKLNWNNPIEFFNGNRCSESEMPLDNNTVHSYCFIWIDIYNKGAEFINSEKSLTFSEKCRMYYKFREISKDFQKIVIFLSLLTLLAPRVTSKLSAEKK